MLIIHCHLCDSNQLIGYGKLISVNNTSEGPVAYARCNHGHLTMSHYRNMAS